MPSGTQLSDKNYKIFLSWVNEKRDLANFKQYVYKGKLKRAEIIKECGFSRSALTQNPRIEQALMELEDKLRLAGILPPLACTTPKKAGDEHIKNQTVNVDAQRLHRLEQENAMLKVEVAKLKEYLGRFNLINEFLSETMRIPR